MSERTTAEMAPSGNALTAYDVQMRVVYLRLLDAYAAGADWQEVARVVLDLDPDRDPERAKRVWESHLKRATWMAGYGYQYFL